MANRDRPRRVSFAANEEEEASEGQPLLQNAEPADDEGGCFPAQDWLDESPNLNPRANLPIYTTIHRYGPFEGFGMN
jgi:hypothetical protein